MLLVCFKTGILRKRSVASFSGKMSVAPTRHGCVGINCIAANKGQVHRQAAQELLAAFLPANNESRRVAKEDYESIGQA